MTQADAERRVQALSERKRALLAQLRAQRDGAAVPGSGPQLLRPGPGAGILLVHPVGGEVLCYGELVRLLPAGYPVHGLAADDTLRGDRPPAIEALVEHYVRRLDTAAVRPALLAGWSFGGMVAYEMARQLAAAGRPCPVAVIDAVPNPPGQRRLRPSDPELLESFAADLLRSAGYRPDELGVDPELWRLPHRVALTCLHAELAARGMDHGLSLDELTDRALVYVNAFASLEQHRPQPDGPGVRLLWATESTTDATVWWRGVAGPSASGLAVAGDHYSLLRMPAVAEVARFLHDAFESGVGSI
jgi:thioesterase domain-containing protein